MSIIFAGLLASKCNPSPVQALQAPRACDDQWRQEERAPDKRKERQKEKKCNDYEQQSHPDRQDWHGRPQCGAAYHPNQTPGDENECKLLAERRKH